MADATLKQVIEFFGINPLSQFSKEWKELTPEDQAQIKAGIGDGTLTY
jgi:hypothetical protein